MEPVCPSLGRGVADDAGAVVAAGAGAAAEFGAWRVRTLQRSCIWPSVSRTLPEPAACIAGPAGLPLALTHDESCESTIPQP